jgi:hypothetical protein
LGIRAGDARRTFAGAPAATEYGGMSCVTMLLAPITHLSLHRVASIQPDAVALDLDAVDAEITEWAAALRRGNAIRAQLLTEVARSAHEETLAGYDTWMDKSRDLDAAQIDGARGLAASPDVPADTDWASFDSGKANADQHRAAGRYLEAQAEQARAALASTMHSGHGGCAWTCGNQPEPVASVSNAIVICGL